MRENQLRQLYVFVFALHVGLLWWLPFFPSQDGPSHVYNTLILRDLLNGGTAYGAFFDLRLFFTPNLGATVPLYLLTAFLPPVIAEKVFLSVFAALLVSVMPRLARLTGHEPFPASFMVFPLLFSRLTLPGFYSFMLGVSLWLWAVWLFWRMRSCPLWQRWLAGNACALVLMGCHLLSLACYALAIGCAVLATGHTRRTLVTQLRPGLVLLALPTLLLGGYGWHLLRAAEGGQGGLQSSPIGVLTGFDVRQNLSALLSLLTFEQITLSPVQVVTGVLCGLLLAWLLCRPETRRSVYATGPLLQATLEQLAARRWLLLMGVALFVAMLFVPDRVGELSLIKLRFGPLIVLVLVPMLPCPLFPQPLQRFLLGVTLVLALTNGVLVSRAAYQVQTFVTALPSTDVRGQFVAGYRGRPVHSPIDPLLHATSYYCARHGCVDVNNYQAHSEQFFVRFKPNPSLAVSSELEVEPTAIAWESYPDVAYLLGWEFGPEEKARIGSVFTIVGEKGAVSVWRRMAPPMDTGP